MCCLDQFKNEISVEFKWLLRIHMRNIIIEPRIIYFDILYKFKYLIKG